MAIGSNVVSMANAVASGSQAKGEAIASTMLAEIRAQAGVLKRFLIEIRDLDQVGRKAFRVAVQHHLKAIRAQALAMKGTDEEATYGATARSATVRMSEAVTFSKACDVGYQPDLTDGSYHYFISQARVFLSSAATAVEGTEGAEGVEGQRVGPTQRRGRQAKSFLDKVKTLVLANTPTAEQMAEAAELLVSMAENMAKAEKVAKRKHEDIGAASAAVVQQMAGTQATVH